MRDRALVLVGAVCLGACSLLFPYEQNAAPSAGSGGKGAGGAGSASVSSSASASSMAAQSSSGSGGCKGVAPDECGGKCVNLQDDPKNCKTCGNACSGTTVCELGACIKPRNCRHLHAQHPELPSAVYDLDSDGPSGAAAFPNYCEMVADGGGWTLLLKVGPKGAFSYNGGPWTSPVPYRPEYPDLDMEEAKLPSCFNVGTDTLRLGMRAAGESTTRWILVPFSSTGMCPWFMAPDAEFTIVGLNKWRELLATPSTGTVLCYEGVNLNYVRLGLVTADTMANCVNAPAVLGFGINLSWNFGDAVGCVAKCCSDNNNVETTAFGYIMGR